MTTNVAVTTVTVLLRKLARASNLDSRWRPKLHCTIDALNSSQSQNVTKPGSILARQVREVIVPGSKRIRPQCYRYCCCCCKPWWHCFWRCYHFCKRLRRPPRYQADISDNLGKTTGRVAVVWFLPATTSWKQGGFVLASDKGRNKLDSGNLGTVDGCMIVIHRFKWDAFKHQPWSSLTKMSQPLLTCWLITLLTRTLKGVNGWLVGVVTPTTHL